MYVMCIYIYMCMYVMCIYIYVIICIYIYILYMLYTYLGKSWPKNILDGVISFANDGLILPNVKDKEVYC